MKKLPKVLRLSAGLVLALLAWACAGDRPVTFGVISDCQFAAAPPAGTRFYNRSWLKLVDSLELFNALRVRFVIHLGDLIDRDAASLDFILPVFERSSAPVRHVIGNHDLDVAEAEKGKILSRLGGPRGFYAFTEGRWRFVVLNGDELGFNFPGGEDLGKERDDLFGKLLASGRSNATRWNGGIGSRQAGFLESELAKADRSGKKVIVFCHFPVYPPASHNLWNDEDIVARLESHPSAAAYFCGHNHAGAYAAKNGIHYLTFQGMVETGDTNAGAVVTLTRERIEIDGFGREPDRILELSPREKSPDEK